MFSTKTMNNFASKYDVDEKTGCWVWNAALARGGDGQFFTSVIDGRTWYRAHRFSYEAHKGKIGDGLVVMHSCDNPACVNPDHLSVGTQADNIRDRDSKGRGALTGPVRDRLSLAQVNSIKSSNENDRKLAEMFGCSPGLIWKIKNNKLAWVRKICADWKVGDAVN